MQLNAAFDQRALVHASSLPWTPSPIPGVQRRMLDRVGDEVARATSLVRYDPGSLFSPHTHHGGEEFLVLEGVFQDEHGDFPAGYYVRNPPSSQHTPGSSPGCIILVKLHQFRPEDRAHTRLHTHHMPCFSDPDLPGVQISPLFEGPQESVRLETWAPGTTVRRHLPAGGEFFVLDGLCSESGDDLRPWSWLRIPPGGSLNATAGPQGTRLWIKTGHLDQVAQHGWRMLEP